MKTRRAIYVMRIAAQCATILALTLIALVFCCGWDTLCALIAKYWYLPASIITLYAVFTLSEDYLNNRVLTPHM